MKDVNPSEQLIEMSTFQQAEEMIDRLEKINDRLGELENTLRGIFPRFYVILPEHLGPDEQEHIKQIITNFFEQCPAGGVMPINEEGAEVLGKYLKRV